MSLKILHTNDIKDNLIIFIHGLNGSIDTFKNKDDQMFHHFFDKLILENCDIGYFEYPTSIWYSKFISLGSYIPGIGNIINYRFNTNIDTITQLLKTVYDINKLKYKNIHYIGHSLGGIIIKNFLINYHKNDCNEKPFFITLSTPHNGSHYAKKFSIFGNPQIADLKYKSQKLTEINENFKYKKNEFYRKYYVAINDQIVKEEDAYHYDDIENKVNVHGNHIIISKPTSDEESKTLLDHINLTIIEFLNLNNKLIKPTIISECEPKIRDILFESYRKESYNYYLIREIDTVIEKHLNAKNLWLFGDSGVGKTNMAQFYISNKNSFHHFTYFTTIEQDVDSYLNILYMDLCDRTNNKIKVGEAQNIRQKLKVILCDLSKKHDSILIHLDELSDPGEINTKEFLKSFVDILTNNISSCGLSNVSLIISTRFDPTKYLDKFEDISHKTKIETLFLFKEVIMWSKEELYALYQILSKALNIEIENATDIIGNTIITPRELKNFLYEKVSQ